MNRPVYTRQSMIVFFFRLYSRFLFFPLSLSHLRFNYLFLAANKNNLYGTTHKLWSIWADSGVSFSNCVESNFESNE